MKNKQGITIAALIIAIVGLSIGFAAFSNTLNISSSANVNPENTMNVVFSSSNSDAETDPIVPTLNPNNVTNFTSTNGTIVESGRTLSNLSAAFTAPGQSVTYNLYVYNDGPYAAYLTDLTMGSISCDAIEQQNESDNATDSLVSAACRGMSVSVTIGETTLTSSGSLNNQSLQANGGYVNASITIRYAEGSSYVDGPMSVTIGNITFTASSVAGEIVTPEEPELLESFEIVTAGKTLNTLELNDEIALGDEHFTFISKDESSVTMFAKYNLNVGNFPYGGSATNRQEPNALGMNASENAYGGLFFHSTSNVSFTPMSDVSDLSSYTINQYLVNYKNILENMSDISDISVTLPGNDELLETGLCSMQGGCNLVSDTSFWTKFASSSNQLIAYVYDLSGNSFGFAALSPILDEINLSGKEKIVGVRPVITVPISAFN